MHAYADCLLILLLLVVLALALVVVVVVVVVDVVYMCHDTAAAASLAASLVGSKKLFSGCQPHTCFFLPLPPPFFVKSQGRKQRMQ